MRSAPLKRERIGPRAAGRARIESTAPGPAAILSDALGKLQAKALETTANSILITDRRGSILWVNRAFTKLTGYELEEVFRRTPRLLRSGHHPPSYYRHLWRTILSGRTWRGEFKNRRKDGGHYFGEQTITPVVTTGGEISHFIGVMQDISARKKAEQELSESHRQLRALAARLEAAREEERLHISREMHDGLGELLTGMEFGLDSMKNMMRNKSRTAVAPLLVKLDSLRSLVSSTIERVQKLCTDLRPPMLDDLGLGAALGWQAREFEERTRIRCETSVESTLDAVANDQATALFRIFQEILTNVARHSGASKVRVALKKSAGDLLLEVRDNGRGISPEQLSDAKSLGLLGMRERAALLGGCVEISGEPGRGTRVAARIPVRPRPVVAEAKEVYEQPSQ